MRDMTAQEKQEDVITELDVLYGADRPWYGFEKLEPSVTVESAKVSSEWITYRRGVKSMSANSLRFFVLTSSLQDRLLLRPFTSHAMGDSKFFK
jgi:hypothetical protein